MQQITYNDIKDIVSNATDTNDLAKQFIEKTKDQAKSDLVNNIKNYFQAIIDAEALTFIYHRSLFTNYHTRKTDLLYAWRLWTSLRYQLFIIKIFLLNSKNLN